MQVHRLTFLLFVVNLVFPKMRQLNFAHSFDCVNSFVVSQLDDGTVRRYNQLM